MNRWKKKNGYGMRWIAESVFSSIKRTFGEYVSSVKWDNIVNELLLKASLYKYVHEQDGVTRQRTIGIISSRSYSTDHFFPCKTVQKHNHYSYNCHNDNFRPP